MGAIKGAVKRDTIKEGWRDEWHDNKEIIVNCWNPGQETYILIVLNNRILTKLNRADVT